MLLPTAVAGVLHPQRPRHTGFNTQYPIPSGHRISLDSPKIISYQKLFPKNLLILPILVPVPRDVSDSASRGKNKTPSAMVFKDDKPKVYPKSRLEFLKCDFVLFQDDKVCLSVVAGVLHPQRPPHTGFNIQYPNSLLSQNLA